MVPARIRLTINFSKRKGKKMKLSQTAFSFVLAAALVGGASSVFAADRYGTTGDAGEAMPRTMMIGISAAAMAETNNLSFKHPVTVLVF